MRLEEVHSPSVTHKLDGLRGLFSLAIVFFHYPIEFLPKMIGQLFLVRESYIFVDFFFVLSGFVIALNYSNILTKSQLIEFLKRRFIRLFPLLFYSSAIFLIYMLLRDFALSNNFLNNAFKYSVQTNITVLFTDFLNTICFLNSTNILTTKNIINSPSWSISAEMISYILYGVIAYCFKKKPIIAHCIIFLGSLIFLISLGKGIGVTYNFGFVRCMMSFSAGCLVYYISYSKSISIKNYVEIIASCVLLMILFINHHLNVDSSIKPYFSLITMPITFSFIIFILLRTNSYLSWFIERPFNKYLGKISYSVYLNHWIVVLLIPKFLFRVLELQKHDIYMIFVLLFSVTITILYSHLTYFYIEKGIGNKLKIKIL